MRGMATRPLHPVLLALAVIAATTSTNAPADESAAPDSGAPAAVIARALPAGVRAVPPVFTGDGCTTGQTNDLDAEAGIFGAERTQTPCLPGESGREGDLTGFAFVVNGCLDGGIGEIALCFATAPIGDTFYLFVWRSVGGLPNDACGLAAYGARQVLQTEFPSFSVYDICDRQVPIADGERVFVGVVYRVVAQIFGPHWFMARNAEDGFADLGYINQTGADGDWVDMNTLGLGIGNRWGVIMTNLTTCAPAPVEETSWGAVKALLW